MIFWLWMCASACGGHSVSGVVMMGMKEEIPTQDHGQPMKRIAMPTVICMLRYVVTDPLLPTAHLLCIGLDGHC